MTIRLLPDIFGIVRIWALSFVLMACGPAKPPAPVQAPAPPAPTCDHAYGEETVPPYNRDEWGGWIDVDRDCQNTRAEVLIQESEIPVTFTDPAKPCYVATGRWTDPYSGQVFSAASSLDIDHVVALEEAHYAGGWAWTKEQKVAYANDLGNPVHLAAVYSSQNRSKGSRGPAEWMPTNTAYQCQYLKNRYDILTKYQLAKSCDQYLAWMTRYCK